MNKRQFLDAKEEDLIRLAKYLRLNIEGMKHKQIAKLIFWRTTRVYERGMY